VSELPTPSEMTGEPHADTIEIELTPEDLSPPSATQQQASSSDAVVTARSNVQRPVARITRPLAVMFAFVALRSVAQYGGLVAIQPHDLVKPVAAPASPQLVYEKPEQPSSPMRMANPFDSSEVFEFPAGTSKAEARESIANVLMQRARDRRPQWGAVRRRARQPIPGETSAS
jgi:hypothetical protein